MSRDLNKCMFTGRLGADPETRRMPNGGDQVTNFSIAVGEEWKDRQTGDKQERTEWVRVVAWRELGKICSDHLRKGDKVLIEGKMRTRKWQDKNGADQYTTEIVAESMYMLGSPGGRDGNNASPQQRTAAQSRPAAQPARAESFDDEIPF